MLRKRVARIQKPSANIFSNILVGYPSPFIFVYLQVFLNVFYGNYSCPRVIDITFVFYERMITLGKRKVWINFSRCYSYH